jgi:hypothetical protein
MTTTSRGTWLDVTTPEFRPDKPATPAGTKSPLSFQQYVNEAGSQPESVPAEARYGLWTHPSFNVEHVEGQDPGQTVQSGKAPEALTSADAGAQASGSAEPAAEGDEACIAAVRSAMVAEGLDPEQVNMKYHEVFTYCPGGSWINKLMRVETPDGRSIEFSAALSQESPQVTVCEIQSMLNRAGLWGEMG